MKQNISISNCFIFCAHKIVEHIPVEKHMVYGRPFEGTVIQAKLAERACPVRSALKKASIKNIFFKQVVFYYLMGTNYETIGDIL